MSKVSKYAREVYLRRMFKLLLNNSIITHQEDHGPDISTITVYPPSEMIYTVVFTVSDDYPDTITMTVVNDAKVERHTLHTEEVLRFMRDWIQEKTS